MVCRHVITRHLFRPFLARQSEVKPPRKRKIGRGQNVTQQCRQSASLDALGIMGRALPGGVPAWWQGPSSFFFRMVSVSWVRASPGPELDRDFRSGNGAWPLAMTRPAQTDAEVGVAHTTHGERPR